MEPFSICLGLVAAKVAAGSTAVGASAGAAAGVGTVAAGAVGGAAIIHKSAQAGQYGLEACGEGKSKK